MQEGLVTKWRQFKDNIMQRTTLNRVDEEGKTEEARVMDANKIEDGANLSPLHVAAIMGSKAKMAALLKEHKEDMDSGDKIGRTPLIYSILGDRYDCAEALLKAGVDVNKTDVDERTALHWAAYQGNQKFVKLLLDKGAKQGLQDKEGRTPLHLSLSHDNIKVMARLLKDSDIDCLDGNGMTPLHFSVAYERVEHTKMLLHAKASPDCQDNDKKTVLHWAKTNKETTIVSKLLDYERVMLILNSKDSEGRTALHLYVAVDNKALVRYLTSREDCSLSEQDHMQRTPLHLAAILGHTEIAEVLLSRGCEALVPDNNGVRPLHYAAQNNFGKTLDAMLQHENVKDEPDNDGRTALMWAAAKGASDALNVLISHRQDLLTSDCSGATALHMASAGGHLQCVTLLLQHQAGVNSLDQQQYTPLFCACQMGHRDVVETLLLHGATVDLEDKEGRTPLHWAAVGGLTDICAMLISHGIDVSKRDKLGRPALHYAAYGGFFSCMSLLLEYGSDVDARDNTGVTALHWACASGSLDAVKLLFRYNAFPNFVETEGDKLTPLDYAIFREHQDVAQFMIERGAFTIAGIQDEAALVIQATWKGYRLRKSFEEQKKLLILHEKKRKETKMKQDLEEFDKCRSGNKTSTFDNNSRFTNDSNIANGFVDIFDNKKRPPDNDDDISKENNGNEAENADNQDEQALTYDNYLTDNAFHHNKSNTIGSDYGIENEVGVGNAERRTDGLWFRKGFSEKQSREFEGGHVVKETFDELIENETEKGYKEDPGQNRQVSEVVLKDSGPERNEVDCKGSYSNGMKKKAQNDKTDANFSIDRTTTAQVTFNKRKGKVSHDQHVSERLVIEKDNERSGIENDERKEQEFIDRSVSYSDSRDKNTSVIQRTNRLFKALQTPSTSSSTYSFESNADLKPWQIYKRERHRKHLIRRKIESAVVIQRAFRTHILRQKQSDGGQVNRAKKETEARDKRIVEDIAALLIQLHWRKYLKRKLVKEKQPDKTRRDSTDLRLLGSRDRKSKVVLHPRSPEIPRRKTTSNKVKQKYTDSESLRSQTDREEFPNITLGNARVVENPADKGPRDHANEHQTKSRPKTDGSNSRRGSKSGQQKISLTPAKQNRFQGASSKSNQIGEQTATNGFRMYMPQNWSSNLQKFPVRY